MNIDTVAKRFPGDTATHEMTILKDDGLFRCIRFARPQSSTYAFTLTTWPGYLAITGDCDDFVFRRLNDMFEFFREKKINPSYWGEKAVAVARHGGLKSFSPEYYRAAIVRDFREAYPQGTPDRMKIWEGVRWELLEHGEPSSVDEAFTKACGYEDKNGKAPFSDFWDHRLDEPAYGFLWACHAIRWGIARYDAARAANDNDPTQAGSQAVPA